VNSAYAVNTSGAVDYVFAAQDDISGGPAVGANDIAYFSDASGSRYAVGSDGKELWRNESDATPWRYPVVCDKNQILFAADGGLIALDAAGNERWSLSVEGGDASQPAVAADGTIYVPVYEVQESSGEGPSLGSPAGQGTGGQQQGTPTVGKAPASTTLQGVELPGVCALSTNGDVEWYVPLVGKAVQQPVVDSLGCVYMLDKAGLVHAINSSGDVLWSQEVPKIDSTGTTFMCVSSQNRLIVVQGGVVTAVGR
jgi:hypothetical protein